MRLVAFKLSMPHAGSWNGKWTGDGMPFVRVRRVLNDFHSLLNIEDIVKKGSYFYNWPDGWCACVDVSFVNAKEANHLRKISKGFSTYDWMIDSILNFGEIMTRTSAGERYGTSY